METKSTGIIRRIDDLGRIAIPKDLRRELKVHEGDAFEIGIITINGKKAYFVVPYIPFGEGVMRQVKAALASLAHHLPSGYEVGILTDYGPIASTRTGESVHVENFWSTIADEAHWIFGETRDRRLPGYRKLDGKDVLYYPVFSYGDILLVLAIAGEGVRDDEVSLVKTTADVLSAMLS